MRTLTIKLYQYDELNEEAKEKARTWYRDANQNDCFPLDDAMESLKALFEAAHIKLKDWQVGPYHQSCVLFDMGDAGG